MKTLNLAALVVAVTACGCGSSVGSPSTNADPSPTATQTPASAPAIDDISPAQGSPAMEVTITGTAFSTTPGETAVFFGGIAAEITFVSATEIHVHPSVPSEGTRGDTMVEVVVEGRHSNGVPFELFAAGDLLERTIGTYESAEDTLMLPSGELLVIDSSTHKLFAIGTDGWILPVASSIPAGITKLSAAADGTTLLVGNPEGIYAFDRSSGAVTFVAAGGAWTSVASVGGELVALRADGSAADRIAGGTVSAAWISFEGSCAPAIDLTVVGSLAYSGTESGTLCVADSTEPSIATPMAMSEDVTAIRALRTEAGHVAMLAAIVGAGEVIAAVDVGGDVMIRALLPSPARAFDLSSNGVFHVITMAGEIVNAGSGVRVLAGPLAAMSAQREVGPRLILSGGVSGELPFVAELREDGAVRMIANASVPGSWTAATSDGVSLFVGSIEDAKVLRIDADGTVSTWVNHAQFGALTSIHRLDIDGSFLVSDESRIVKYDAYGALVGVLAQTDGVESMAVHGADLWIAAGDSVARMPVAGGPIVTVVGADAGFTGMSEVAVRENGTAFVADSMGSILEITGQGPVARAQGYAVRDLSVDAWGRILVTDEESGPYMMLP